MCKAIFYRSYNPIYNLVVKQLLHQQFSSKPFTHTSRVDHFLRNLRDSTKVIWRHGMIQDSRVMKNNSKQPGKAKQTWLFWNIAGPLRVKHIPQGVIFLHARAAVPPLNARPVLFASSMAEQLTQLRSKKNIGMHRHQTSLSLSEMWVGRPYVASTSQRQVKTFKKEMNLQIAAKKDSLRSLSFGERC